MRVTGRVQKRGQDKPDESPPTYVCTNTLPHKNSLPTDLPQRTALQWRRHRQPVFRKGRGVTYLRKPCSSPPPCPMRAKNSRMDGSSRRTATTHHGRDALEAPLALGRRRAGGQQAHVDHLQAGVRATVDVPLADRVEALMCLRHHRGSVCAQEALHLPRQLGAQGAVCSHCSGIYPQSRRDIAPSEITAQDAEWSKGERTQTPGSQGAERTRTIEVTQTQR